MMPWEMSMRGRVAAEDILRSVAGIEISKALDPLHPKDFDQIVRILATELRGQVVPVQDKALKIALSKVDADWVGMSGEARGKVLDEATKYITTGTIEQVMPSINTTFSLSAKSIIPATKSKAKANFNLDISGDMSATDHRIVDFARRSQGHFIRDKFGKRQVALGDQARSIVSMGLQNGYGSSQISNHLFNTLNTDVQRSRSYWDMIANVFANRARTMTQLATFDEAGIVAYAWESVLDEVTTVQCRFLHGQKFPVQAAMTKFQQVEDSGDPESIKTIQPFVNLGKNEEGKQILYYNHADGSRRTIAHVEQNAFGQADEQGKFSNALDSGELLAAGIHAPPIHGNCRSSIIPEFGSIGTGSKEYSIPSAPDAATNAPAPTPVPVGSAAKTKALDVLSGLADEVGDIDLDSENPIFANTEPQANYHDVHQNDPYVPALTDDAAFAKESSDDTVWIGTLRPTRFAVAQADVEKLLRDPHLLASQPLPKVFTNFDGQSYLLSGHETVIAKKLLGQLKVDVVHYSVPEIKAKVAANLAASMKPLQGPLQNRLRSLAVRSLSELQPTLPGGHADVDTYLKAAHKSVDHAEGRRGITHFTSSQYVPIRAAEAGKNYAEAKKLAEAWDEDSTYTRPKHNNAKVLAQDIERFFKTAQPMPGTVYRGMKRMTDASMSAFLDDDHFIMGASSSTTRNPKTALNFASANYANRGNRVVMILHQKSAVAIETISSVKTEGELLLPKSAKFHIVSRHVSTDQGGGEVLVIEAEEI